MIMEEEYRYENPSNMNDAIAKFNGVESTVFNHSSIELNPSPIGINYLGHGTSKEYIGCFITTSGIDTDE
ncbi:MAG: hypothetical protein ACRCX2_04830 [Paraclostridium sp.]